MPRMLVMKKRIVAILFAAIMALPTAAYADPAINQGHAVEAESQVATQVSDNAIGTKSADTGAVKGSTVSSGAEKQTEPQSETKGTEIQSESRPQQTETQPETKAAAVKTPETKAPETKPSEMQPAGETDKPSAQNSEAQENNQNNSEITEMAKSISKMDRQIDQIAEENKLLHQEIKKLTESETENQETETESEEKVMKDENAFLRDIKKANEKRAKATVGYSEAEIAAMTNGEIAEMNKECVECEKDLYDTYKNASFKNKNLEYLCALYMKGLKNQFDAYDNWQKNGNITKYNELWDAGYNKRSLALTEIVDTYKVDIKDMDSMRKTAANLMEKDDTEAKTDLSYDEVVRAQNDLNTLGFENTADGKFGSKTALLLRRFQSMFGYGPADGILDKEALSQLDKEAAKVSPKQTKNANTEKGN